ncbi:MAG: O-antigen ligase family protein, partial [Gammaproteobacteria bacterium]
MQILANQILPPRYLERVLNAASLVTTFFIVSIYFSTAVAIVGSILTALMWLLSGRFICLPETVKTYPVAAWSLVCYAVFFVGLLYGNTAHEEAFGVIKKYRELLFIPVLLPVLSEMRYRDRAWRAFVIASVISLAISYLMSLGVLETDKPHDTSLKSRITHGIFISFFAFYCLHKAVDGQRWARGYLALFLLAIFNLYFIVEGRTGQLIALVLIGLFALQRLKWKGRLLTCIAIVVFLGIFLGFSGKAQRVYEGIENTQAYMQENPGQTDSSMGLRYTFWKYSLKLIAEKPWLGHGTGSFAAEYARVAQGEKYLARHPHNEFLFIGVQLGLLGLIPYVAFLGSQVYQSRKLPDQEKWLAQGLLAALVVTSLFNTPIYDHTEGHWFA